MHDLLHRNKKNTIIVAVSIMLVVACFTTGIMFAYSKNISLFGFFAQDGAGDSDRLAAYDVQVDGKSTDVVDFTLYATTKLSDIEKTGNKYKAHSFLPDAYQVHTITVTNNSEVKVNCYTNTVAQLNDDRVFMAVLPKTSSADILKKMYTDSELATPDDVRDYIDTISFANKDIAIDMGESAELTMICWCEHDAVYSNSDEVNLDLAHLAAGVPHEQYKLDYYFTQID